MRINVYSQELTKQVMLVSKEAETGVVYYGARMMLDSPKSLHYTDVDDDRSAITFWLPNAASFSKYDLARLFHEMGNLIMDAPDLEPN